MSLLCQSHFYYLDSSLVRLIKSVHRKIVDDVLINICAWHICIIGTFIVVSMMEAVALTITIYSHFILTPN